MNIPTEQTPIISLSSVTKTFNSGKPSEYTAVSNATINLQKGKITVLKGPSGSGKTTLLSLIGCMIRPTSGRIFLHGNGWIDSQNESDLEITSLTERFLSNIRRNAFGFIFQQFNLIKGISVIENIMLPAYPAGEDYKELKNRAAKLIDRFSLKRHLDSRIDWLSGGEMQRVAIARALINNPGVIIADEPTAHLDSKLSEELMKTLYDLANEGKTVIIASHDPVVYESSYIRSIIEMRDGIIHQ